jgi:uncharacterized protein with ParB-like and HNH nuclease domain
MQDYERRAVPEVIEEINRKYFLPDIQRNFVWKPEQVYTLFDSIMRDYPISTFLFWKQDGAFLKKAKIKKLEFVKTSKDQNKENTEISTAKEYFLVLDGQQRLTTFYLVLKGNYIIRNNPYDLYFNILSGQEEQEDGILYEFKFFNRNKGESFQEDNDGEKKIWYRVKDIYDLNIAQIFSELTKITKAIKDSYSIDLSDDQKNSIARLCQYLKAEKIIYYYPEIEQDYDKVLDIFVRTNSGGTQLSYSDLLFSTIKSQWSEARNNFDSLLSTINDNDRYKFTSDFVLKTALVVYANSNEEVRYKTKNFKSSLILNLKKDWNQLENAMKLCIDLLSDKMFLTGYKCIPSNNALIPVIYWMFKNNLKGFGHSGNSISDTDVGILRTWLTKSLLSGIFGGQSDAILYKCKETIANAKDKVFPATDIENRINNETKKSMKLDADILNNVKYNSGDSFLVLSICYKGSINFKPRMNGNLPEQDHIFSQNELKAAKISDDKINSIFNIRYIGSSENKSKSGTPFVDWVKTVGTDKDVLKKHLIPEGKWDISNFDSFLNERRKLIENTFKYR